MGLNFGRGAIRKAILLSSVVIIIGASAACNDGGQTNPRGGAGTGEASTPALQGSAVGRGEIAKIVNATGSVRPDITVDIGSEVSGKILSVNVDFNSVVKEGDILAVIDPENLENRVTQNEAQVENSLSDININMASLKRAEVNAAQAKRSLDRRQQLYAENAISQAQLEETERSMALADADVELAQARLEGAQSSLKQARANLASAKVDLARTVIRAPIDGVIIERLVDPGQTVAASFNSPELFRLAGDLSKVKVDAAIVESDVSGMGEGDIATFTVDAYPGRPFRGTVDQLRLQSKTESNIVTYTAVISADNTDGLLMPGMTTSLQITTDSKSDILRIPASAERFRPTPDQIAQWEADKAAAAANEDVDPKTRDMLSRVGVSASKIDAILAEMAADTVDLRAQIADPTQQWQRNRRISQLREAFDAIIKTSLTTPEYQSYRRILEADASVRDAVVWIKDGEKMRSRDVGLGLSDGSYTEVISGLSDGDVVITGLGGGGGGGRGGRPGRPG